MPYNKAFDQNLFTSTDVESQGRGGFAVTPNDSTDLAMYAKALYIGGIGTVVVIPVGNADNQPVTFTNHPVGYMPMQIRRVLATGTTATNIVAILAQAI